MFGKGGEIATPVCALVRNDMENLKYRKNPPKRSLARGECVLPQEQIDRYIRKEQYLDLESPIML